MEGTQRTKANGIERFKKLLIDLARFRYELRRFLRFSERAARQAGVTPQQHQLMLGVAGFTGRGWATISELAEFLQARHNAVVGLVNRACRKGLVLKKPTPGDLRFIRVELSPKGRKVLLHLSALHRRELRRFRMRVGAGESSDLARKALSATHPEE
jgi:DNA-binding MarR family transcriptional regulator